MPSCAFNVPSCAFMCLHMPSYSLIWFPHIPWYNFLYTLIPPYNFSYFLITSYTFLYIHPERCGEVKRQIGEQYSQVDSQPIPYSLNWVFARLYMIFSKHAIHGRVKQINFISCLYLRCSSIQCNLVKITTN